MSSDHPNPYIGPRTFRKEEGDRFFGRDREAADLEALVASEKLVLFYAQSGAGKSSLINARLIPSLEEKEERPFEVLPARVSGDVLQGAVVDNIYVYNMIHNLLARQTDPQLFRALTLSHCLKQLNEDEGGYFYDPDLTQSLRSTFEPDPWPRILIIDQFEEVFSTNVEAWQQREEFFRQLAQAMQDDPFLWILLVMREDYIAALDPYVHLLPGGLRVRYYMERLSHEAAVMAIRSPVEKQRPYAEGVAEKLTEDLSRVKVQKPDGRTGTEPGQYIEPVQLQVVCYSLWENLPSEGTEITEQNLQDVGDVNQSLARYYDQRVSEVAKAKHVRERQIRDWFDQKLITRGGIRNMVIQERETRPGGLDDEVIQALQSDLVRAEQRGGATWYELTHDRLVEPVRQSNAAWFEKNLNLLQKQAKLWVEQGRREGLLLTGREFQQAEMESESLQLTDEEKNYLEACRILRKREVREQRRNAFMTVIAIAAIIALFVAGFFYFQAQSQAKNARVAKIDTMAVQSMFLRDENFQISLLLGIEAINELSNERLDSVPAQSALLKNSQTNPRLEQFLYGKTGPVVSAIFSPDGKTLASGTYDKDIMLWDVKTRRPIDKLIGHKSIIRSIAFNPDGSLMASGSQDNTIMLWDMKTRQPLKKLSGHLNSLTNVAFSPDGRILASGSEDTTIILWDVEKGQAIGQPLSGHSRIVRSVAFNPDGKTLASGGDDGKIILWDVQTRDIVGELQIEYIDPGLNIKVSSPVLSVAFSPDGSTLASGDYGKHVTLWDVKTRQPIQILSGHSGIVRSVAFSPDGKTLASGSADKTIILWDTQTGQFREQLRGHSVLINSLSFSPDGSTLASGSGDTTIILWDMNRGQPISRPLNGYIHFGPILSIAFSPDGKTLASGSLDTTIMLWDVEKGQSIGDQPLSRHTDMVRSVAFSAAGMTLASGSNDKTIILWDVEKRAAVVTLSGHSDPVTSVAFSPDDKMLASGSEDSTVRLWDVENGQSIGQPLSGHTAPVNSIAFSPDGKVLASGSEDSTVILWDVEEGLPIGQPLSGHAGPVNSVAFSPDGKVLASGSGDRSIILWDVKTRKAIVTLNSHVDLIYSVAFSPDGKMLASGSLDETIILWDVKTHQPIGALSGASAPVQSVAFSPDGKTLASSSFDITLWDANEQLWAKASCQRAGRNFTQNEWEIYFPNEAYRKTCPNFPLESVIMPTGTP